MTTHNEYAKQIIQICDNALKTNDDVRIIFNPDFDKYDQLKTHLFNEGFEIKDFYYNTLYEALNAIKEVVTYQEVTEALEDYTDDILEYAEADVYTHDLLNWLSDDISHLERVDEKLQEGADNLTDALMWAQNYHKVEIYQMAINFIVEELEE